MDPFSSFDLFRRRVDQMFAEFDQQMFGTLGGNFDPFFDQPLGMTQPKLLSQQGHEKQLNIKDSQGTGGTTATATPAKEEESRMSKSLTTRPTGGSLWQPFSSMFPSSLSPMKLDIIEDKEKYLLNADVPGFTRDQIKLSIKDGMLTVSAETKKEKEEHDAERQYHRIERSRGSISRAIRLPENIKEDQISATSENGVLKVIIPKQEMIKEKKEKTIQIR